jgi:hypothetical protein
MRSLLAAALLLSAQGQEAGRKPDAPASPGVDPAIARGLSFLLLHQDKDGAIHTAGQHQTALTALAAMALAAVGHQPADETKEGRALRRALQFILRPDRQEPSGYFGAVDGSRMYGHGMVTLALAELLGMGVDTQQDKLMMDRCRKGVELILRAQAVAKDPHNKGGWRYLPESADSDLSATIWQVMALRSAKNAGLDVPKQSIAEAVEYIKRCYFSARGPDGKPADLASAFAYGNGRAPVYSTAAAGVLALQMCGEYDAVEVSSSVEWLRKRKLDYQVEWFFYGTYYFAQGMYQRGGETAAEARRDVEALLLSRQNPDGSWTPHHREGQVGPVYATSLAVLSLAVKHHYLPIYQR